MKLQNAILLVALLAIPTARAGTVTVTTTADSGPGSLRAALASAADGDIIDASGVTGAILLTTGELLVNQSVTVAGPGPDVLVVDGQGANRVFHIFRATVAISGLTISNGLTTGFSSADCCGAGIFNDHAALTISNVTVSGNSSELLGGGIMIESFFSTAQLTAIDCVFSGNKTGAGGAGGAIFNSGYSGTAEMQIIDCTFQNNLADSGGGIYNGGYAGNVTATIVNSTFTGNVAAGDFGQGGAIFNDGGSSPDFGIAPHGAAVTLIHSTLSGNSAQDSGGAIYNVGAPDAFFLIGGATVTVLNSTLSGNRAGTNGGGIYNNGLSGGTSVEVGSSILDAGVSGGNLFNDSGDVYSVGFTLCSDDGAGLLTEATDRINTDPLLGPLEDNGGSTLTHALLCGSPAVDRGFNFSSAAEDQRGAARSFENDAVPNPAGGDGTDIGAVESQGMCNACETIDFMIGLVVNAHLREHTKSLVASLRSACEAFKRKSNAAGIENLHEFQHKVKDEVARRHRALAEQLIEITQQIIDAVGPHKPGKHHPHSDDSH